MRILSESSGILKFKLVFAGKKQIPEFIPEDASDYVK